MCNIYICSRQTSLRKTGIFGISPEQIRKVTKKPVTNPRARINNIVMEEKTNCMLLDDIRRVLAFLSVRESKILEQTHIPGCMET